MKVIISAVLCPHNTSINFNFFDVILKTFQIKASFEFV